MVTQADLDKVHERVTKVEDKVNISILKLTGQVTKLATIIEERFRPQPINQWKSSTIRAVVHVGELALIGLFVFWISRIKP